MSLPATTPPAATDEGIPALETLRAQRFLTDIRETATQANFLRMLCYYPDPYLVADALYVDRWALDEFVNSDEGKDFKERCVRAEAIGNQSFAAKAIFQALNGEEELVISNGKVVEYFYRDLGQKVRLKRKRINPEMLKLFLLSKRPDLKEETNINLNVGVGIARIPQFLDMDTLNSALEQQAERIANNTPKPAALTLVNEKD